MKSKLVLLVENNKLDMKLLRLLLTKGGYSVLEASDGENGIQLARQFRPDLVLMDIHLPRMDGLSAARMMKQDPQLNTIPIIALTAHGARDAETETSVAGCEGYVSRPVDTRTLLKSLARYIDGGSAGAP